MILLTLRIIRFPNNLKESSMFFDITGFSPGMAPVYFAIRRLFWTLALGPLHYWLSSLPKLVPRRSMPLKRCMAPDMVWNLYCQAWTLINGVHCEKGIQYGRYIGASLGGQQGYISLMFFLNNQGMLFLWGIFNFIFSFCGCNMIHCMIRYIILYIVYRQHVLPIHWTSLEF